MFIWVAQFTWQSSSSWMIPPWGCGSPSHHRPCTLRGAGNTGVPCSWGARRRSRNPPWYCRSKCHGSGNGRTRWGSRPWTPWCVPSCRACCRSSSCRILYTVCEINQKVIIIMQFLVSCEPERALWVELVVFNFTFKWVLLLNKELQIMMSTNSFGARQN